MTEAAMTTTTLVAQAPLLQPTHLLATAIHREARGLHWVSRHHRLVRTRAQTNALLRRGSLMMKRRPYPPTSPR
jgi:hypothetical protein